VIRLLPPTVAELRAWSSAAASQPFTYGDVGATRRLEASDFAVPRGFTLDRIRVRLGAGDGLFEAAATAVLAGRMFPTGWFRAALPERPVVADDLIAIAARCGGLWWGSAARVVYVVDEADASSRRRGFAYGTLPPHVERGEERFLVEQRTDGSVWYDLAAFSRPRHPLLWAAYPLTRRMQAKFRRESVAALQSAVARAAADVLQ
jgi:uncharacterized protein (UPF0548 family)